jgi:hypothetical protein
MPLIYYSNIYCWNISSLCPLLYVNENTIGNEEMKKKDDVLLIKTILLTK